ncbi:MAG: glycosyltransferase family 1 protein, partial [Flavobacterium sp.]
VIPNGVDTEKFQPTDVAQSNDILYFGTLIRKKGLLELPHIFNDVHKLNPSAKLLLVGRDAPDIISGNPSTWEMMKPLFSADSFKNVSYLGGVPYDEIRKYIESAAVCVFPTFAEALPVSWIEAMAMRKPLVASNIGWASEVIEDGKSGFLEHPKNHSEFAAKISNLISDADLRQAIGKEARNRVLARFDNNVVAKQNISFYNDLQKR